MSIVKYNLYDFITCSDNVKICIDNLQSSLSSINTEVEGSDNIWDGEAHASFKDAYGPISTNCNDLIQKLEILKENLMTINALYSAHESNTKIS